MSWTESGPGDERDVIIDTYGLAKEVRSHTPSTVVDGQTDETTDVVVPLPYPVPYPVP